MQSEVRLIRTSICGMTLFLKSPRPGYEFPRWVVHSRCPSVGIVLFGDLGERLPALPDEGFRATQDILYCSSVPASQGAFPDHKCAPSVSSQRGQRPPVPIHVGEDFDPPERGSGFGPPEERASMTVPETAVARGRRPDVSGTPYRVCRACPLCEVCSGGRACVGPAAGAFRVSYPCS